jgi:DNA invertase Pin-like site-specific DNA recombinase
MIYGYVRVSSREQNEDRQLVALEEYKVNKKNIFIDKQSGKDFNRTNYKQLIKKIKKGDVLVVKSIDRLGRNYNEILEQWRHITQTKKCDIVVLDMPLLDTTKNKDLFGTFISDLTLQILSFVAENERINIRQRQSEGIAAAKARGVKFGRPKKYNHKKYKKVLKLLNTNQINRRQAIKMIGCSGSTLDRLNKEYKNETEA